MIFEVQKVFSLLEFTFLLQLTVVLSRRHSLKSGTADLQDILLLMIDLDYEVVVLFYELHQRFLIVEAEVSY